MHYTLYMDIAVNQKRIIFSTFSYQRMLKISIWVSLNSSESYLSIKYTV